jgi:hypothetical protein
MPVMAVSRFERFFRVAAGLDVDKDDLRRYDEFVTGKLHDLMIVGEAKAAANGRDVIEPHDLPITKGLQESIHQFRRLDEEVDLEPILERLAQRYPQLDRPPTDETEAELAEVVGGLSVALARSFTIVDPELVNPSTEHWERAFRLFDLLL